MQLGTVVRSGEAGRDASRAGITVVTASYYESALIRRLIENLTATAQSPDLQFVLCDNTNGADRDLQALASDTVTVVPLYQGSAVMSERHGNALTQGFERVRTELCLMIDPDCRVLCRGWDTQFSEILKDDCVAVGAPFPPWKLGKYHDYPGPHFALFRAGAIRQVGADWRPYSETKLEDFRDFFLRQLLLYAWMVDRYARRRRSRDNHMAARCERALGVISKDTGWRISRNVHQRQWRAELLEPMRFPADGQALAQSALTRSALGRLAGEFELYAWKGVPMVAHCGRTSRLLDVCFWTGRPLLQIPRFWDRSFRSSVDEWEALCTAVTGAA